MSPPAHFRTEEEEEERAPKTSEAPLPRDEEGRRAEGGTGDRVFSGTKGL